MSNVARNDITRAKIQTKNITDTYRNNFDAIFSKKQTPDENTPPEGWTNDATEDQTKAAEAAAEAAHDRAKQQQKQ